MSQNKFYITTPIYYVNAKPHIGHAYTTIAADALARWHRLIGDDTFFSAGTDEHGAKIEEKAREAGLLPQVFADGISAEFQNAWDGLDIKYDRFIRTTEAQHVASVQTALKALYISGEIYLGTYEGLYCRGCEQYKSDKELIDGKCPDHLTVPEVVKEDSYMFRMSKYQQVILDRIRSDEFKIRPQERRNEMISFLQKEKLKDVSFSRKNVAWGIPVPWDETHTIYVWADAFLNYLTALDWTGEGKPLSTHWPPDVQLMSKDILRVHATIWPAMVLALGLDLPRQLFVHGFFLIEGQKMSKSLGNVIAPEDLAGKFGADAARYLLLSSTAFGHDGDIGWDRLKEKYNADLANGIGNLAGRVLALAEKYLGGSVPAPISDLIVHDEGGREQVKWKDAVAWSWESYGQNMQNLEIDKCLETVRSLASMCDRHITATALWKFIRENQAEGSKHLYCLLEVLRHMSIMLHPFMPETADKLAGLLGCDQPARQAVAFDQAILWGGLAAGSKVEKGAGLFPRIE